MPRIMICSCSQQQHNNNNNKQCTALTAAHEKIQHKWGAIRKILQKHWGGSQLIIDVDNGWDGAISYSGQYKLGWA